MRTQVAIIGAGPAGLTLGQLLARRGIESVIVENRSRAYVEARIRAGVLEQGTVDVLHRGRRRRAAGPRGPAPRRDLPAVAGERHHLDFPALCGRSVWIYGQTEVVKDLIAARLADGQELFFDVRDTAVHDVDDRAAVGHVHRRGRRRAAPWSATSSSAATGSTA